MKLLQFISSIEPLPMTANGLAFILRFTIGLVMFPHGAQLILGWFNGPGFSKSMEVLSQGAGLPSLLSFMVIVIQFFGSIFLVLGLFTRYSAVSMFVIGVGMIFSGHIEHGFFMNWFGAQKGEGFEFHLLLLGLCASSALVGAGKYSVDSRLFPKKLEVRWVK